MNIFSTVDAWRQYRQELAVRKPGQSLGFVPTMGALHEGHLSLVRRCRQDNDLSVVSIYVNPTQFDQAADLASYPRQTAKDLDVLRSHGVDAVFLPDPGALYPDGFRYRVRETELSREYCGAHRPGHFDGVLTVVMKLLNIVQAHNAYFGEKDYQQLQLIRGMAEAFFLPVNIHGCPIVREPDGLAMSSRNLLLDPEQRRNATRLYQALRRGGNPEQVRAELEQNGFSVDYVADFGGRRLAAARLGSTRLIDNVPAD